MTAQAGTCDAYVAAAIADFLREELMACGQSLSFETVMSHESKIEFFARARAEGYRTYLYFIATDSPALNVGRVKTRAATGGHDVPEGKTRQRVQLGLSSGAWGEMETSINALIDDLLWPTREVTRVIGAVAQGDLLHTVNLDVDGRPLRVP